MTRLLICVSGLSPEITCDKRACSSSSYASLRGCWDDVTDTRQIHEFFSFTWHASKLSDSMRMSEIEDGYGVEKRGTAYQ